MFSYGSCAKDFISVHEKKKKKKRNAGKCLSIKGRAIILEEDCNYPDFQTKGSGYWRQI